MNIIGHISTDFPAKFGIPRQSGLIEELKGVITFEPEYRHDRVGFQGIGGFFTYMGFMAVFQVAEENYSGNGNSSKTWREVRMGVFATRSPFRPNDIGLSCVKLEHIEYTADKGPVLFVSGVDMVDGTPIYDIKPYVKFTELTPRGKRRI